VISAAAAGGDALRRRLPDQPLGHDTGRQINENPAAAQALKVTKSPLLAASAANLPDVDQVADRRPH
jgi:hypothetical protein